VYNISNGKYYRPSVARQIVSDLGLEYVPIVKIDTLENFGNTTVNDWLNAAEMPSYFHPLNKKMFGEGIVVKVDSDDSDFSFKAISRKYSEVKSR
jgi:hypothetical protein